MGGDRERTRRRAVTSIAALVLLFGAVACSASDDADPAPEGEAPVEYGFRPGGTLRLGVAELSTFDPALVIPTEPAEMIGADLLFDSLTVQPGGVVKTGMPVDVEPDVASSLTPDADHMVWTVVLAARTFSDGAPVTAADAKYSLERVAALGSDSLPGARLEIVEGYDALAAGSAGELTGLTVVDDETLEIRLVEPFVDLPVLLSSPVYGIVPRTGPGSPDAPGFDRAPVGSGPYRVVAGGDLTDVTRLERSPGPAGDEVGPDAVELVEFASVGESYAAFARGEIDWSLVPSDELREATNVYSGDRFEFFGSDLWLGFNMAHPRYRDIRFRQAIARAVDPDRVVGEALPGRWPLRGLVPRGVPGFEVGICGAACEPSVGESRRLLREVFGGGAVPTVVLDGYDDPLQSDMLSVIAGQLAEVGIPTEIRLRPQDEYATFLAGGEQGVFSFGSVGLVPLQDTYLAPPFQAGSPDNVTGVQEELVNGLIAKARATPDAVERREIYRELERTLLDLAVAVPIAQSRTNQVLGERVRGFDSRLDGTFVVGAVWLGDG
jgi:oligopeptide transport system substrate-binding protein